MPSNLSGGLNGIWLGFPLAIYSFVGWENSATLAEETGNPRKNIPLALIIGTIAIGLVYVFLAYATEIAFHNDAKAIGNSTIPYIDAIKGSAAGLLIIAYLAGITSIFSCLLGLTNSQGRILFSAGRESLLPRFFGKIHPQRKTPHIATWSYILFALAVTFVFGWNLDPVTIFDYTGTVGTIPIIIVYLVTTLALPVYILRFHKADFNILKHAIIPALAIIGTAFPLWGLVQPGQPAPYSYFPAMAGIGLVIAIIYGVILARRSPALVQRIGSYVADEDY